MENELEMIQTLFEYQNFGLLPFPIMPFSKETHKNDKGKMFYDNAKSGIQMSEKEIYDWFDFKTSNSSINNHKVIYLENIDGLDLFNVIKKAKKTIACHGTITLLGNLVNTPILDLFNCEINSNKDFYQYKNSFHEHVPKNNYDFIIPNKNIDKSLRKMKFSLIK